MVDDIDRNKAHIVEKMVNLKLRYAFPMRTLSVEVVIFRHN